MKRFVTGLLLVLALTLPALADKAKNFYKQGQLAEQRQDYEAAYDSYLQAYKLKPGNVQYHLAVDRTRFEAAASHVHRGQLLREQGKLEEALAEFQRASAIDPALFIAQQEATKTRGLIEKAKTPKPATVPPTSELGRLAEQADGPVELKPISNVPITLRMTEDTKVIYTTIGKLAGINVLFDPDYVSRRVSIELNGVSLYQALEIVALQSKTFYRPVTPNTVFVAADTKAKRTELEQSVVKTFYMNNLSQATELQDVVNTLRTILEVTRVLPLPSQNAIVVRGTPDQVALAEKLIGDIDKAKPEVIVEVAIMQVTREKIRNLGFQPPQSASVQLQPNVTTTTNNNNNTTNNNTTNNTSNNTTTGTTSGITLNTLANLNANDFQVTIPAATANLMFSDSNTKIIQNPQIRALDGQKATLKIGDRVPVATGSFQPGIGGVGINPLVNTQFQYLDVGVNVTITPHVHAGREVSLKVEMEVSSVTSQVNIGGIQQPVIGQRRIEHEIRLREGEVNVLGGIMEHSDVRALSGYPWISQVPILKYLFSSENVDRRDNEILFVLIPKIVRGQDVNDINLRPVDVGTANAIDLRRAQAEAPPAVTPQPQPASAAQAPPQPVALPAQPATATAAPANPVMTAAAPPAPPAAATPTPPGAAGMASFDPPQIAQAVNSTFPVNIAINGGQNLYSVPLQVSYDPKMLQLLNVSNGGLLSHDGQPVTLVHREDENAGSIMVTVTRPPGSGGVTAQGSLVTLTFLAKAPGQSSLSVTRVSARDPNMQPVPISGGQAVVTVK